MLKESKTFDVKIHLAKSLPLPVEKDHLRPRLDLIVFLINLQSQFSYSTVVSSLSHVDASFFLGKVCFLATGGDEMKHAIVEMSTVKKLADSYLSILLFSKLNSEGDCCHTAQRLLQLLRVCAGHVPGVSALYLGSMMRWTGHISEEWMNIKNLSDLLRDPVGFQLYWHHDFTGLYYQLLFRNTP
ncbi:centromere protein M-like isoform X2 [Rhinatrema bivittatum]|nr:centromere protein M-like isoform X2 [Rhinatrema bivittatum]